MSQHLSTAALGRSHAAAWSGVRARRLPVGDRWVTGVPLRVMTNASDWLPTT